MFSNVTNPTLIQLKLLFLIQYLYVSTQAYQNMGKNQILVLDSLISLAYYTCYDSNVINIGYYS